MTNNPIRSVFRIVQITPLTFNHSSVQLIAILSRFLILKILKYSGYSAMTCTHMRYRHNRTYQIAVSEAKIHLEAQHKRTEGVLRTLWRTANGMKPKEPVK